MISLMEARYLAGIRARQLGGIKQIGFGFLFQREPRVKFGNVVQSLYDLKGFAFPIILADVERRAVIHRNFVPIGCVSMFAV